MPLTLDSPRFSARDVDAAAIEDAIDRVGHVVIDDLWDVFFLLKLHDFAARHFQSEQTGSTHLPDVRGMAGWDENEFFDRIRKSSLPGVLRHMQRGDFVVSESERVIRRANAAVTTLFSGLHADGQLRCCSDEGIRSKREFTIWTPLVDCTGEDTPRLLLLHRDQHFYGVFSTDEQISDEGIPYFPLQLRPVLHSKGLQADGAAQQLDRMFERLYDARQCYAPHVPLGSAVLFEHNIVHGSYRHSGMTRPRYSMDFRAVGEYRLTDNNRHIQGRQFSPKGIFSFPSITSVVEPSPVPEPAAAVPAPRRPPLATRALYQLALLTLPVSVRSAMSRWLRRPQRVSAS